MRLTRRLIGILLWRCDILLNKANVTFTMNLQQFCTTMKKYFLLFCCWHVTFISTRSYLKFTWHLSGHCNILWNTVEIFVAILLLRCNIHLKKIIIIWNSLTPKKPQYCSMTLKRFYMSCDVHRNEDSTMSVHSMMTEPWLIWKGTSNKPMIDLHV